MDLSNRNWAIDDGRYAPKRKVNNKYSNERPHVIGTFPSHKMGRMVEYESLGEFLLFSILELDKSTLRYYVQPVEVPIPYTLPDGQREFWIHVPDVLVFRQGSAPHLYQVKEATEEISDKNKRINEFCTKYAKRQEWTYSVVYPKTIPSVLSKNATFLVEFLKYRKGYEIIIPEVKTRMAYLKSSTIIELATGFQPKFHPFLVLPCIYYLIATGVFHVDLNRRVDETSEIMLSTSENRTQIYLRWENSNEQ